MNYGTKMSGGKLKHGYLDFSTGKKVRLTAAECEEFANRLRAERAAGRLVEQHHQQEKDYYLLIMHNDIEAELSGPFCSAEERDKVAQMHRVKDSGEEDGLHTIDVPKGAQIEVGDYSCGFLGAETYTPKFWKGLTRGEKADYLQHRMGLSEKEAWEQADAKTVADLPSELGEIFNNQE